MIIGELRIGNITNFGEVYQIEKDCFYVADLDGTSYKSTWADIQPVRLTEEWLVRFGFKFKSYGYGEEEWKQWSLNGYSLNGFRCITSGVELEYVHTLQNLYFALENKELTTKNQ
jgi:hypothetical protein